MGRKNTKYKKDLHQQAYDALNAMQAFGESKKEAIANGTSKDKIYSFSTYQTYYKHIKYFLAWVKVTHPECATLKAAKKYVNEWLQSRVDKHLSAWTIATETAALCKLYQIPQDDPDRFTPPRRERVDIKRSRKNTVRDKHFSKKNNAELIAFCRSTGCRRNVLEKLEGRDLWTRRDMEKRISALEKKENLTESEKRDLNNMKDALIVFPDEDAFLHHRKDKNGKYRFAPIVGPDKDLVVEKMKNTERNAKVWESVSGNADVHGYRADYAIEVYRKYARPIEQIPFNKINRGTGRRYQGDIYACRKDKHAKYDKAAMLKCSKALGHNRLSVIAENYLYNL